MREEALGNDMEKSVNQSLLDLHEVADGSGDPQMTDFLVPQGSTARNRWRPPKNWQTL